MQLQQLAYFVEIVERGTMNQAAKHLFISQSSLSKSMNNLEKELNITLFCRSNKGVTLTQRGRQLYEYAKTVLSQMTLIENLKQETENPARLRIGAYPSLVTSKLLAKFAKKEPGVGEVSLWEGRVFAIIEQVKSLEAELGLLQYTDLQEKELRHHLKYNNMSQTTFLTDTWYVVVGPKNPYFKAKSIRMADVVRFPILRVQDDYFSNLNYFVEIDGVRLDAFERTIFINNLGGILCYLMDSEAVNLCDGFSARELQRFGLHVLPIDQNAMGLHFCWFKRSHELLSAGAQAFVSFLPDYYASLGTAHVLTYNPDNL
ncbi:Transcriptional regulator, LysR family [Clostridiaceae bacterium JG1575]|nr:Transcriptional regulator, LysR family [Clostridiaceae bacterium JG1575]